MLRLAAILATSDQLSVMGRTIPTASQNLRYEQADWKSFRNQLPKAERKLFDEMFDIAHTYNYACMMAMPAHPVRIQPIFISILFQHYKDLSKMIKSVENRTGQNLEAD